MARILVAVADGDECDLYVFALRFAGHLATGSGDLRAAIQHARDDPPELILVDAKLLGAFENQERQSVSQEIKSLSIPVLLLMDRELTLDFFRGLIFEPEAYIYKPISPDQLIKRVNRFLRR